MESNRDEAERCIGIALAAVKANQPERARRFLEKAQRLYPSPRVRGERRRARGGARGGGGGAGTGGAACALPPQLRGAAPARCGAARGACRGGESSVGGGGGPWDGGEASSLPNASTARGGRKARVRGDRSDGRPKNN